MTLDEMATILDGLIRADALRADLVPGAGLVRDLVAHLDIADAEADANDAEDDAEDEAEDAEDEAEDDAEDGAPEKSEEVRRGWEGRRLSGEPEGKDYLFRRVSDGSWYCLRGRHVTWSDDRSAAEVRRGIRAAGATALGISTHAGSTIEMVDADSGVVVRRYAEHRRVD